MGVPIWGEGSGFDGVCCGSELGCRGIGGFFVGGVFLLVGGVLVFLGFFLFLLSRGFEVGAFRL